MTQISKNLKDTTKIADNFLSDVLKLNNKKALVVGLYGNLGSGKTTFVKAVGRILGIKKINSPTFLIMKRFDLKKEKYKNFFHLDAYRLENEQELIDLGWEKIVSNPKNLVFIEWPENVKKIIPKNHHKIRILHKNKKNHREFKIKLKK